MTLMENESTNMNNNEQIEKLITKTWEQDDKKNKPTYIFEEQSSLPTILEVWNDINGELMIHFWKHMKSMRHCW